MEEASRVEELEQKLSHTEYCRRHDLKPHQLTYWKKRFCRTETGVSFVPLQLIQSSSGDSLWLVIHDHFKVEIRSGFDRKRLIKYTLWEKRPVSVGFGEPGFQDQRLMAMASGSIL
ncbi:MAG: transposase, partial [Deltaproteobacteria bacterium]|nr:transposase [Deltaproteobacteria bacterium]